MTFFDAFFLWKEAVASSLVLSITLAAIGTYTMLRRVVFLPAALSQLSGLGVMVAFWLLHVLALKPSYAGWLPLGVATMFTLSGAMAMGRLPDTLAVSREAVIGGVYVTASAFIIVFASVLPQESHHVDNILFGNAVLVEPSQLIISTAIAITVLVIHFVLKRQFMFISFDSETARVHGLHTRRLDILLFVTMAVAITVSTKTIGALPTFTFSVLPPWFAIQRFNTGKSILIAGMVVAAISSFAGYWISFELDLPTGATTTLFTGAFVFLLLYGTKIRRKKILPQKGFTEKASVKLAEYYSE